MPNVRNSYITTYIQRLQKQQQHNDERHPHLAQPFNKTDVRVIQLGGKNVLAKKGREGQRGVGNSFDSGPGVDNGLDRGRVDVLDDDRRPTSNVPYPNTRKDNKSTIATKTRTRSGYGNSNGNHQMSQATQPTCRTAGTIQ